MTKDPTIDRTTATLNLEELEKLLEHDIHVKIAGVDIDGVLRGKTVSKSKFLSAIRSSSGIGFCSIVFGWDLHDTLYDQRCKTDHLSSPNHGYPDMVAIPDVRTFRRLSEEEDHIPFFLIDFPRNFQGDLVYMCSRTLLRKFTHDAYLMGFLVKGAVEYEFYNYQETPNSLAEKHYTEMTFLTPGMFGYSLLRPTLNGDYIKSMMKACSTLNIPIESFHTETGRQMQCFSIHVYIHICVI
jgi:glutamine synthetase